MEILDKVAELAGAVAAVEAEKRTRRGAALLAEGVAAVMGCEGGGALWPLAQDELGSAGAADNAGLQA